MLGVGLGLAAVPMTRAVAQEKKPNIVVIVGDDVGWDNFGDYNRGREGDQLSCAVMSGAADL